MTFGPTITDVWMFLNHGSGPPLLMYVLPISLVRAPGLWDTAELPAILTAITTVCTPLRWRETLMCLASVVYIHGKEGSVVCRPGPLPAAR